MKFNLQLFAEAVAGKKIVYPIRVRNDSGTEAGTIIAFTTENGRTKSKDADSTATKDGSIRTPGTMEQEITATCILAKGDTKIKRLEQALDDDELIEIWEANLEEPVVGETNKFYGKYFQGYITELEKTSNAEDMVEISLTFAVNGKGVDGEVTVTVEQQEAASYVFVDTPANPSVVLSQRSASLVVNDTLSLEAVTFPAGQTVTWTTSDSSTATVSNGVVTAKAAGNALITASITIGSTTVTDSCYVVVSSAA